MTDCDHRTGACKSIVVYKSDGKTKYKTMKNCNYITGVCQSCTGPGCP